MKMQAGIKAGAVFVWAVLGLVGTPFSSVSAEESVSLRADIWCPYNCEPGAEAPGYVVEIAKTIFEAKGYKIDYGLSPWKRTLEDVNVGTFDGAIGASSVDGAGLIFGAESIGANQNAFAVLKGANFKWKGAPSLEGKRLGGVSGYDYGAEINGYIEAHKKDKDAIDFMGGNNVVDRNLLKLMAKRVDLVIDNAQVLAYAIKKADLGGKIEVVPFGDADPLFIGFTTAKPQGKKYADIFDAGIAQMRRSGKLQEILDRYGVTDWK